MSSRQQDRHLVFTSLLGPLFQTFFSRLRLLENASKQNPLELEQRSIVPVCRLGTPSPQSDTDLAVNGHRCSALPEDPLEQMRFADFSHRATSPGLFVCPPLTACFPRGGRTSYGVLIPAGDRPATQPRRRHLWSTTMEVAKVSSMYTTYISPQRTGRVTGGHSVLLIYLRNPDINDRVRLCCLIPLVQRSRPRGHLRPVDQAGLHPTDVRLAHVCPSVLYTSRMLLSIHRTTILQRLTGLGDARCPTWRPCREGCWGHTRHDVDAASTIRRRNETLWSICPPLTIRRVKDGSA